MSGRSSYMPPEPGQDVLYAPGSGQLIYDPGVTEKQDDRYAAHSEARRQGGVFLGVDLDDGRFTGQFFRYGSHRRCE
jgi:hypothetical protein